MKRVSASVSRADAASSLVCSKAVSWLSKMSFPGALAADAADRTSASRVAVSADANCACTS